MAAAKKAKDLTFKGKPIYRKGNKIYYGNLDDKLILEIEILETKKVGDVDVSTKVRFSIQDNTVDEVGTGINYRTGERDNLYKAFDMGAWWLQDALSTM
ncbi:MAG: hypothetical protein SOZ34_08065 [Clostridia bacterium]|nr:hypothetical protein [Clostridia bacterium]